MNAKINFLASLSLLFLDGGTQIRAGLPEPSTLFYGKVLHRDYGQEHKLTEGSLTWTLRNQDGVEYTYAAELEDIKGVFSYRIAIPHQALSAGLNVDPSVIPLGVGEADYDFVSVEVDGYPAAIFRSEIDYLSLIQGFRAATYRIDLVVSFDLTDTDRDGLPDWWEQIHGLDWQRLNASEDLDGDGLDNLNEYFGGTDPAHDDRAVTLQTLSLAAYAESDSGVWLRTVDVDTPPEGLEFTLTGLPGGGSLVLIPPFQNDPVDENALSVGDTVTQEQLNQGALIYRHADPSIAETSFSVTLSDGVHAPYEAEIAIDVFPPKPLPELEAELEGSPPWWRDENIVFDAYWSLRKNVLSGDLVESALLYLLGRNYGWTLWDQRQHSLPVNLEMSGAGSHFILGGQGDDELRGGARGDILTGGPGADSLWGGADVDLFIVGDEGEETIEDFDPLEDILDLSDLLTGQNGTLNANLNAGFDGTDTLIGVDQNGDGSDFTDAVIRLAGLQLNQDDLHRLWSRGQLLLGAVQGLLSVTIENWPTDSLEEGYSSAALTLRRNGPTDRPLTVSFNISGSATNGSDYRALESTVTFGTGEDSVTLVVEPLTDGAVEGEERVHLALVGGPEYLLGAGSSGQIDISDAKQRFNIQALQRLAIADGDPAYLLISRRGPVHTATSVFLNIAGTALSGEDYGALPTVLSFTSNQTDMVMPVNALGSGALGKVDASRLLSVEIAPSPNDAYFLGETPEARVLLLHEAGAFESWIVDENPGVDLSLGLDELKAVRSPRTGFAVLLEYALSFGLDLNDGVSADEHKRLLPQVDRDEAGYYIEFTKRLNDENLEYVVECSVDLRTWRNGAEYFEAAPLSEAEENSGRVRYRVFDSASLQKCFIRVRVNLAE